MSANGIHGKIKSIGELSSLLKGAKKARKTVVLCHGVFDLLHPGHIRHLFAAKRQGDLLIVTVTRDEFVNKGPGRPVFNQNLRAESIAALGCVDFVAVNDWPTAKETILRLKPDLYVKGQDYRDRKKDVTKGIRSEESAIRSVGGRIVFTEEPMMSSSRLLNEHFGVYPPAARDFLAKFSRGHAGDAMVSKLDGLKSLKVLAVGEAIVDEYHYCQAMGKSPKETIVSTRFVEEERFAGGILAAANHMAGFAGGVHLVTCLGTENSREGFIRERLKPGIRPKFFLRKGASTIIKRRFVDPAFLTKMFEVSYIDDKDLPRDLEDRMLEHLERELPKHDLVLVIDYGHGMIGPRTVDLLCRKAKYLAVNSQTNSANMGYNVITKYPRADYVCIDEPEIRLALRDRFGDIQDLARQVSKRMKTDITVVTRGHRGALAFSKDKGFVSIPVFSQTVVDRTGAGDAFLSVSALCAAAGYGADVAAFVGNAAGAMKVGTVCNRTAIEPVALAKYVTAMLK
ncbi:MAG: adenylyltransferase/cytidyltransferase family protein [Elusimicrobia bacterium]|nr:adenylyltransferase/cytidyltransferase family protein [Elusimicrobiota bacterium]